MIIDLSEEFQKIKLRDDNLTKKSSYLDEQLRIKTEMHSRKLQIYQLY